MNGDSSASPIEPPLRIVLRVPLHPAPGPAQVKSWAQSCSGCSAARAECAGQDAWEPEKGLEPLACSLRGRAVGVACYLDIRQMTSEPSPSKGRELSAEAQSGGQRVMIQVTPRARSSPLHMIGAGEIVTMTG